MHSIQGCCAVRGDITAWGMGVPSWERGKGVAKKAQSGDLLCGAPRRSAHPDIVSHQLLERMRRRR